MKITREADYAIRIIYNLMGRMSTISAREIAEQTAVTPRFTLKILNKLGAQGIVSAKKGSSGGYMLDADPEKLSIGEIIECIDGPIEIAHCLANEYDCSRVSDRDSCPFHKTFGTLNEGLKEQLYKVKMSQFKK